ncbi:MAG: rRNA maturation RNase YbeY [Alphaproteobacteria bacterium]|nr:rRNA maturation RNase YbeY [Alphaproteobacteria bacterium]
MIGAVGDAVVESTHLDSNADTAEEADEPEPNRVAVAIRDQTWQAVSNLDAVGLCRRAAAAALAGAGDRAPDNCEISIVLADDTFVRELNRDYRGIDRPTNVLAFPASEDPAVPEAPLLAGDVVIARQTTTAEAAFQGKPLADHLTHLVVHGVLHLFGFDHQCEDAAAEMERLEIAVLGRLRVPNPYALDTGPADRASPGGDCPPI